MKLSLAFFAAAFAAAVSAATINLQKRAPPLEASLTDEGDGKVRLTWRNSGSNTLRLFKWGTAFDEHPTQKLEVFASGNVLSPMAA